MVLSALCVLSRFTSKQTISKSEISICFIMLQLNVLMTCIGSDSSDTLLQCGHATSTVCDIPRYKSVWNLCTWRRTVKEQTLKSSAGVGVVLPLEREQVTGRPLEHTVRTGRTGWTRCIMGTFIIFTVLQILLGVWVQVYRKVALGAGVRYAEHSQDTAILRKVHN